MRGPVRIATGLALGAAVLLAPLPASAQPGDVYDPVLSCTYTVDHQLHKVSGSCEGRTGSGSLSGSFEGSLRPGCSASGKFELRSTLGAFDGSFTGDGFDGGKASGKFKAKLGGAKVSGKFVARVG